MSTGIVSGSGMGGTGIVGSGINIKQIALGGGAFGPREVEQMTQAMGEDTIAHRQLREAVQELESSEDRSPAAAVRLGVCYYLLGRNGPTGAGRLEASESPSTGKSPNIALRAILR